MRVLADESELAALIGQLGGKIRAAMTSSDREASGNWALVGIRSRGDLIAARLAGQLDETALQSRVGSLDITLYRDDLSEIGAKAVVRTTDISFSIDDLNVVLVDDVLMSGRSVRAALQSLMDLGRPRRVWLAVLVDRGGRELPIQPDYTALDLSHGESGVEADELVDVRLRPLDDADAVIIRGPRGKARIAR